MKLERPLKQISYTYRGAGVQKWKGKRKGKKGIVAP